MATKTSNDSMQNEELGGKANALHDEVLVDPELMNDAFMAENREHEMGLWVS
jgi:SP family general alpha glucoside:H+ symporter-like MFS transporter